ncbi:MAG: VWA domain-containing protein [Desulfurococcaceae archaeon]
MRKGVLSGVDYTSPLVEYRGEKVLRLTRLLSGNGVSVDLVVAVDVFYALYLPAPVIREDAEHSLSKSIVTGLLSTRVGALLRSRTVLDTLTSLIASAVILSEYHRRTMSENQPPVDEAGSSTVEDAIATAYREVEAVSKVRNLVEGLQPGSTSSFSVEDYGLELLRLAREADVREVLKYLEGVKHWDIVPRRAYSRSKRGEKLGYELGFDVERLSPRNFAYPSLLFYAKLATGRLLLYEKGIEYSLGPVYVLIDKSGSMEGEKMLWAKAIALALYAKAVKSGRDFYARFFDSQPHQLVVVRRARSLTEVTRAFEYIARVKSSGGTDITRALLTALKDIESAHAEKSTIVLVTDGIDRVGERTVASMLRKTETSLVTVMVKGDNPSLRRLSTAYLAVTKLTTKDVLKVVKLTDELNSRW